MNRSKPLWEQLSLMAHFFYIGHQYSGSPGSREMRSVSVFGPCRFSDMERPRPLISIVTEGELRLAGVSVLLGPE